ncbi:hypothetical protein D3C85_877280 [compost metagenome]
MHGKRLTRIAVREAMNLVDPQRIALLGDEQALADRVVSQTLEALVAAQLDAQRQLLGVGRVDLAGVLVQAHLDQALSSLVGDHIEAATDVFDRLGIAKSDQLDPAQDATVERQLDQFRVLVGDGEQAAPIRVVSQRRDVVVQADDRLRLNRHPVIRQPDRVSLPLRHMAPLLRIEPGTLEQAVVLGQPTQHQQHRQQQPQGQTFEGNHRAHCVFTLRLRNAQPRQPEAKASGWRGCAGQPRVAAGFQLISSTLSTSISRLVRSRSTSPVSLTLAFSETACAGQSSLSISTWMVPLASLNS